jgi:lipoprotein NlpD
MWRYLCLTSLLLVGCANQAPVPVANSNAPTAVEASPPAGSFYVVQPGDTLYHIATEHGIDVQSLAAWNNIADPTDVAVGRQLRLTPPDAVAPTEGVVVNPVVGPGQVTVIGGETAQTTGVNTEMIKREPRGGTVAYSEAALAQARATEGGGAAAGGTPPAENPPPKPEEKPAAKPTAPPPTASQGGLQWSWPAAGKVVSGFAAGGAGKIGNKGIDIAGRMGEPIYAAAAGKVTYVGSLRGYGDFLVIRHNPDYISVYAHTGRIVVKKDQSVAKGQKIAEVGTSDAARPELHFEIRRQSKPVDPLKILPARP